MPEVDADDAPPYVACVNLLLLLSALLSAMTGVGASVRQPQPATAVMQQARSLAATTVRAPIAQRPAVTLPRLVTVAITGIMAPVVLPAGEPLYLTRLRE